MQFLILLKKQLNRKNEIRDNWVLLCLNNCIIIKKLKNVESLEGFMDICKRDGSQWPRGRAGIAG